jgi:hypothetical protein
MSVREMRGVCYALQVTANVSLTSAPPQQLSFSGKCQFTFAKESSLFRVARFLRLWRTDLLDKLTVAELVKTFVTLYGTRRFIT